MQRTITGALALVLTTGVLAACGGSDAGSSTAAPAAAATTAAAVTTAPAATTAAATTAAATTEAATTPAEPSVLTIQVVDEKPVGGVAKLKVKKGDQIHFVVESDSKQEVHLHGYDVAKDAAPGEPAEFDLKATIEGVFEAELEDPGVQILKLTVEP